ncbi:MAG: DUF7839 domain-containing protein [Thermoplasmatota archaeon]
MELKSLRDRTAITRVLIVAQLSRRPNTLSDVARALGITVQAVSAHAKALTKAGWLAPAPGGLVVTPQGLQGLHEGVRRLAEAVASVASALDVIQSTSALAAEPIRRGEAVGLWMEGGELVARPGKAPSRGRAHNAASPGEEVVVGDLEGMVQLQPGPLTVMSLPGPAEGGVARLDRERLKGWLREHPADRLGAHGTGALILARSHGPVHFEFAADRAAFNAAERGLSVNLLVTRDRLPEVMACFERLNRKTLRRVPVQILEAPERPR